MKKKWKILDLMQIDNLQLELQVILFERLKNQIYLLLVDFITRKDISEGKKFSDVKYARTISVFEALADRLTLHLFLQV